MTDIVLFNGPPGCGKDTAAVAIASSVDLAWRHTQLRMSEPIKAAFAGVANDLQYRETGIGLYESIKEEPIPWLKHVDESRLGRFRRDTSYRQWQIDFSERFMKAYYGQDIFARIWVRNAEEARQRFKTELFLVPDCGFEVELAYLAQHFGPNSLLLVRIAREGHDFARDSRSYIHPANLSIKCLDVENNDLDTFRSEITTRVMKWLMRNL